MDPLTPADRDRFRTLSGFPQIPADTLDRQRPDALLLDGGARCALWWQDTPPHDGQRLGLVGHYAATSAAAGARVLANACAQLAEHGCTLAVGPMDGNTWQRYRFVTERGTAPPFFLEPDNPDDWPHHFTAAGFTPLAQYYSALNTDLGRADPRAADRARRVADLGVTLRPLRLDDFDDELRRIHALSLESFAGNFLYSPISQDDFLTQYRAVRPHVRPELVLLAEQGPRLVGYLFTLPDLLQAQRGQPVDTAILKTVAVAPDLGGCGLGSVLTNRCQETAAGLGFRRAIHALFHETNRSGRISGHSATVFRRYTLFARPLTAGAP